MSEVFTHVDRCSPASLVLPMKLPALIVYFGLIRRLLRFALALIALCDLYWFPSPSGTFVFRLSFTSLHVKLFSVGFWNRVVSQR